MVIGLVSKRVFDVPSRATLAFGSNGATGEEFEVIMREDMSCWSAEQRGMSEEAFAPEEVDKAIFAMRPRKTPRFDEFHALFFQKNLGTSAKKWNATNMYSIPRSRIRFVWVTTGLLACATCFSRWLQS